MEHTETLQAFAHDLTELPKRDVQRLKKEPFPTMLTPKNEAAIDQLRGWKPPSGAYILFETKEYHLKHDGTGVWTGGIFTYTAVESSPDQKVVLLREYQKKGWRIIHYANFPKLNDPIAERAKRAKLYSNEKGQNPWDTLEVDVQQLMRENPDVAEELKVTKQALSAKDAENEELKAKLSEMQKRVAKSEK